MMKDKAKIGLRSQDIQTGLQDFNVDEYLPGEFRTLPFTGMAARLALHIRGKEVMDYKQLSLLSAKLGIRGTEIDGVVRGLDELGWVKVNKQGNQTIRITESVPYFSDIYSELGAYASNQGLSELEELSLSILDRTSGGPISVATLRAEGVERKALEKITKLGEEGAYLATADGEKGLVLYSPLYWQENGSKLPELLREFSEDTVQKAVAEIRSTQGLPLDFLKTRPEDDVIRQAISLGLLPTPSVNSVGGERRFIFTPYMGSEKIELLEKHVYEKALLILSCVRYGENFAHITKIADPRRILNALLDASRNHRIGPHSEIALQYSPLVLRGVGRVRPSSGRYFFELIATPENLKATRVAFDLLTAGEPIQERGMLTDHEQQFLSVPGDYKENLRSVGELKRKRHMKISQAEAKRLTIEFAEIMSRGAL